MVRLASLAGQAFDKYDMLEEVGHGGMAVVYRARDSVLDREVAVKILHAHLADREESRQRLRREAITVAKLRHKNIVEIYDYSGVDADEGYIVTEFIHGVTLRKWLDTRWVPRPALAALVVHKLSLALDHAHDLDVVHRDVKPENVMIRDDGLLKLMDFGIAQILDHQKLTMTGQLLGSPAYMAPELISGKPIDARTDLFSVGIMLYQLATGQLPFSGRNPHEVLNRIADCEFTPASEVNPLVDHELEAIIDKSLARNPDDRYASARALANDLEDYLAGLGLDVEENELKAYFRDAEAYVDELDDRVCAHLLGRARAATAEGHSARALKLLGRVLEIAPQHREARAMLDSAKLRGIRMRQLLVGASLLALAGFLAAGFTLIASKPTDEVARVETSSSTGDGSAGPRSPGSARANRPSEERPPPTGEIKPRVVAPVTDGDGAVAPEVPRDGSSDSSSSDATDGGDPPPSSGDGTTTGGGAPPEAGSGGGSRVREQVQVRSVGRPYTCQVKISGGPPVATLLSHRVRTLSNGDNFQFDLAKKAFVVSSDAPETTARLVGDKTTRWTGKVQLTPELCRKGPVTLRASPEDVKLKLAPLPTGIKPKDVLVKCLNGFCEGEQNMAHLFHLKMPSGQHEVRTRLMFSSRDGQWQSEREIPLYPGNNRVDPKLRKVGG